MALAKLSIDLEARLANLQAGLDKAGLLAERQAERMQRAFSGASKALTAAGGAIAAAFSVSVITRWVSATVDGLDALNDLADATGASVENLSALEDIAARTGTSMDTAGDAVIKLNKALADAKPDNDIGAAFKALNLDVAELKRLDPVQAFQRVAIALSGFADDANKARLTQELFGKSLKDVAPLLKDVAEAGTLQAKVTAEQAAEAETFNKQIFAMQKSLQDLSRLLLGPVVKSFNDLADSMGKVEGTGGKLLVLWDRLISESRSMQGGLISQLLGKTPTDELLKLGKELAAIDARLNSTAGFNVQRPAFEQRRQEIQQRIAFLQAQADAENPANYGNEGRRTAPERPSLPSTLGGDKGSKTPKPKAEKVEEPFVGPQLPDALAAALKRLEQADEVKLARLREELAQLLTIAQAGGAVSDSAFAQVAEEIARLDPAARAADEALKKLADDQARLNDIISATPTGKMDALLKQIEFINAQFAAGNIKSVEQWAEAIRVATGTMDSDVKDAAEKGIDAARELGLTFSSAFEDAIVGGAKLSDVLKGLEKDILRIVSRKLVTEPLAGATTDVLGSITKAGSSGGFEGILSEIGSKISGLFGGFFADGGFLPPGKWGMAGERGPEPIFGGRTGLTVQPAGGMTVHQHFSFSAPVSRSTEQQVGAAAARGLQRASSRNN